MNQVKTIPFRISVPEISSSEEIKKPPQMEAAGCEFVVF